MATPLYVLTGFLGAGKTSLLNRLLVEQKQVLALQFETGEAGLVLPHGGVWQAAFSKRELEKQPGKVAEMIAQLLNQHPAKAVWVEWNGMASFQKLQDIITLPALLGRVRLCKVIHVAEANTVEGLLGRTGAALPEQLANSDVAVLRGVQGTQQQAYLCRLMRSVRPGLPVCRQENEAAIRRHIKGTRISPMLLFGLACGLLAAMYMVVFDSAGLKLNTAVNMFLGVLLQAIPFLLIGVLLSSLIQTYVSNAWIEKHFPRSLGLGMLAAVVSGFCLPVCDCASIPIFRTLVRKGVPLPAAVTFMAASPVINPVVILSTYNAFNGDWRIVAGRVGLGLLSAVVLGLTFALCKPRGNVLLGGGLNPMLCSCGCYEDPSAVRGAKAKLQLMMRHAQAEFFDVGKYLLLGTLVSTLLQTIGSGLFAQAKGGAGLVLSIAVMMLMAFVLSLCSSSDAVVARSFATRFPMGAIMGFLVFGPMMDIKNILMLSSGFSRKFIIRLCLSAFIICLGVVALYAVMGGVA